MSRQELDGQGLSWLRTSLPPRASPITARARLPSVDVDSFNIELKDDEGFLGDRASKGAFREIFDRWRKPLRKTGKDPFGDVPSDEISKKALDDMLVGDDTEA